MAGSVETVGDAGLKDLGVKRIRPCKILMKQAAAYLIVKGGIH